MKTKTHIPFILAILALLWPAAVRAQSWVDFSTTNASLIFSPTGQNFALGTGFVNVRKTGGVNTSLGYTMTTLSNYNTLAGFSQYTFTFTGVPDVLIMENELNFGLASSEQVTFDTNGNPFTLVSTGSGTYNISGIGTDVVSMIGGSPWGQGAMISSIGATEIVWTHAATTSSGQGLRIGTYAVPEPSGALLLCFTGALGLLRRRR